MKVEYDIIECEGGFQVEAALDANFTTYSKLFPDAERAKDAIERLAERLSKGVMVVQTASEQV